MAGIIEGRFTERRQADQAIAALRAAGYSPETIGLIPQEHENLGPPPTEEAKGASLGAVIGAIVGAVLFALAGWLLAQLIPGLAATGGWVALFLALAGGIIGWVLGGVIGSRNPLEYGEYRREALERGRMLVTVEAADRPTEARDILLRFGGTDVRDVEPGEQGDYGVPPDAAHGATA
jgi:hypothetical protein